MFFLEFGEIVYILVNDDPEVVGLVVRGNLLWLEGLRHGGYLVREED